MNIQGRDIFLHFFNSKNFDFKLWLKNGIKNTLTVLERKENLENKLKPKEKLFCLYFCQSRSPRLAAANAGYGIFTKKAAAKLMSRTDIQSEIEKLDKLTPVTDREIISGYRSLAFGSAADAFSLILGEESPSKQELDSLDLLNISEIKRPKGGGIEIKFFDRLKALEKLYELASSSAKEDSALPFYTVIEKSAAALKDDFDAE